MPAIQKFVTSRNQPVTENHDGNTMYLECDEGVNNLNLLIGNKPMDGCEVVLINTSGNVINIRALDEGIMINGVPKIENAIQHHKAGYLVHKHDNQWEFIV